jgi:hypothetical protein
MKIKIRSDEASKLQKHGWSPMGDWLAELRDDSQDRPASEVYAEADGAESPWSELIAQADVRAEAQAQAEAEARAQAAAEARAQAEAAARAQAQAEAEARAQAEAAARAQAQAEAEARAQARGVRAGATERAVIGDQLRMPVMWCEMGSCISWYTHPAALGEEDTRARAIGAGWRIDALGRLACPQCQQTDPGFWAASPVVPWDRYLAIARAARVAAVSGDSTSVSAWGGSGDPGRPAGAAASPPELRWYRQDPAA